MSKTEKSTAPEGRLDGKKVIVLGGSSGIGYAVAEYALAEGATVVIGSSNAGRVDAAVKALGTNAEGHALDLSNEQAIEAFFNATGSFDHLVFTAGDSLRLGEIAATDLTLARRAFDIRYWGALAAVKYGAPHISTGGSIVLTTGVAALRPRSGWAFGASACGAMEALTRALAVELAPLRVNAVSPGLIATNLWQNMSERRSASHVQTSRRAFAGRTCGRGSRCRSGVSVPDGKCVRDRTDSCGGWWRGAGLARSRTRHCVARTGKTWDAEFPPSQSSSDELAATFRNGSGALRPNHCD